MAGARCAGARAGASRQVRMGSDDNTGTGPGPGPAVSVRHDATARLDRGGPSISVSLVDTKKRIGAGPSSPSKSLYVAHVPWLAKRRQRGHLSACSLHTHMNTQHNYTTRHDAGSPRALPCTVQTMAPVTHRMALSIL